MVEVDDVLRDGEAEAEAAAVAGVGLAEALENVREERRVDPLALIGDADLRVAVEAGEAEVHLSASRRELDRVREDVADDLLQAAGVGGDEVVDRLDVREEAHAALGRVGA